MTGRERGETGREGVTGRERGKTRREGVTGRERGKTGREGVTGREMGETGRERGKICLEGRGRRESDGQREGGARRRP